MASLSPARLALASALILIGLAVAWFFLAPQWTGCACPIPGPSFEYVPLTS